MTILAWKVTSGDFGAPGNWTPSGPPGSGDTADFNSGGGSISGIGNAAALNFMPGPSWTLLGQVSSDAVDVEGALSISGTGLLTLGADGIQVGRASNGTLTVAGGGKVLAAGNTALGMAALAIASLPGSTGTVVIDGSGSQVTANGDVVIGGTESLSGIQAGGAGTLTLTGYASLQASAVTIEAGGRLNVDYRATLDTPAITIDGGTASLAVLTTSTSYSLANGGTLKIASVIGANTIANFGFGDAIDVNTGALTLTGNVVYFVKGIGMLTLPAAPANADYQTFSDGSGGTLIALSPKTIGVYRFFDNRHGTHFYTADLAEAQNALATRPDLVPEGVGLQAISPVSNDPNATPVYRFFDTIDATYFYTSSASERDSVIASRPDLVFEPKSVFYEHTRAEPGDTPVYRFFDTQFGTHFYTASAGERASILSTRSDLIAEGIGFYEPPRNVSLTN